MTDVTPETFDAEVLKADKPVVVEFWAPWCGPCRTMKPLLKELDEAESARLKVALVNVQDHPDLANQYGIMAIPTFLAFHGGSITGQHVGTLDRAKIAQLSGIV